MEVPIPYNQIEDVYSVSRWDSSQKFYIRIVIHDGSVLLQVSVLATWLMSILFINILFVSQSSQLPNKWVRDQWLNSINWKVSSFSCSCFLLMFLFSSLALYVKVPANSGQLVYSARQVDHRTEGKCPRSCVASSCKSIQKWDHSRYVIRWVYCPLFFLLASLDWRQGRCLLIY